MGKTMLGAAVSLDGFVADENDDVGPLFDFYANGDVEWSFSDTDRTFRSTRATADFETTHNAGVAACVIGRRLFDITNGWNGVPAAGEHIVVVTHAEPTDWEHRDTAPFTFVESVEDGIAAARAVAGDRDVSVTGGDIGGQALRLGLIDQVVIGLVPVVLGAGRPFFGTGAVAEPILLENPSEIVPGDRVTHLVYDVKR